MQNRLQLLADRGSSRRSGPPCPGTGAGGRARTPRNGTSWCRPGSGSASRARRPHLPPCRYAERARDEAFPNSLIKTKSSRAREFGPPCRSSHRTQFSYAALPSVAQEITCDGCERSDRAAPTCGEDRNGAREREHLHRLDHVGESSVPQQRREGLVLGWSGVVVVHEGRRPRCYHLAGWSSSSSCAAFRFFCDHHRLRLSSSPSTSCSRSDRSRRAALTISTKAGGEFASASLDSTRARATMPCPEKNRKEPQNVSSLRKPCAAQVPARSAASRAALLAPSRSAMLSLPFAARTAAKSGMPRTLARAEEHSPRGAVRDVSGRGEPALRDTAPLSVLLQGVTSPFAVSAPRQPLQLPNALARPTPTDVLGRSMEICPTWPRAACSARRDPPGSWMRLPSRR